MPVGGVPGALSSCNDASRLAVMSTPPSSANKISFALINTTVALGTLSDTTTGIPINDPPSPDIVGNSACPSALCIMPSDAARLVFIVNTMPENGRFAALNDAIAVLKSWRTLSAEVPDDAEFGAPLVIDAGETLVTAVMLGVINC